MDDLLPSYESVIERDPWKHIARYLPSEDLCSAAVICQKWHKVFAPHLWGSPASHFGVQNDTVYTALTRFKRILPYVRPTVRELTHTLHFPPAHAEIYGGPHAEWLRDCLEYLPRLQCLIVDGLPFFDHASLLNLRHSSLRLQFTRVQAFPVFSLRLLDAAGCTNATSTSLAEALPHFPELVSLDLSRTLAAKDRVVLTKLKFLLNLRVLRLQSLGLRDEDCSIIAQSVGTKVRSLDLANNNLTDVSARLLLDHCVKETVIRPYPSRGPLAPVDEGHSHGMVDDHESQDLVTHLRNTLTNGFIGSLAIEEGRDVGVTHLYLTRNAITVEGISGLLRSERLQVLDIGELPTVIASTPERYLAEDSEDMTLPGVSKLTPVLSQHAKRLRYLRVNYQIVTEDTCMEPTQVCRAELSGDLGRYTPTSGHELPAYECSTPELDSTATAVAELPADSMHPMELSAHPASHLHPAENVPHADEEQPFLGATKPDPNINITSEPTFNVGDSAADAPDSVLIDSPSTPTSPRVYGSGTESLRMVQEHLDVHPSLSPIALVLGPGTEVVPKERFRKRSRHNSTYYTEDRRARLDFRQSQENRLHPGMLPQVHTLVLTDVPTATANKEVVGRIIQFIKDAAEEASIARQRARHTYILPPGRRRAIAESEYARSLFALRRIVLEMAPPEAAQQKISSSWRAYPTKSSTEDKDSEAFWEAAAHDFSFFGDEECGLPDLEPGQTLPLAAMSGLELAPAGLATRSESEDQATIPVEPMVDVVEEIGKFRKDRKTAYNNLVMMGQVNPEVEGWWPGDITVVRRAAATDQGELDCYGNRYEAGWYYR
ncbi:hypothetical protein J1614_007552 [Plenodomus biglobosus]|nr:hypothetical protein J1614_007552 [Plenodomus biglobosus]